MKNAIDAILAFCALLLCANMATAQTVKYLDDVVFDETALENRYTFWYKQLIEASSKGQVVVRAGFPSEVEMRSQTGITLKPGFTVEKGARFHGYIGDVEISSELEIDAGEDKVYCFSDEEELQITLGGTPTIINKDPDRTYTVKWTVLNTSLPIFIGVPETQMPVVLSSLTDENPVITMNKDYLENRVERTIWVVLEVTDDIGNAGHDIVTLVHCDDISENKGIYFQNHGASIYVGGNTMLNVSGNVLNENGGVPGYDDIPGVWVNKGAVRVSKDWTNDATNTVFEPDDLHAETELAGTVFFSGKDQTIDGENTTEFNDVVMSGEGVKHLLAETELTVVKGSIDIQSSEVNCHCSSLRIDNDEIDALVKLPHGRITTYNVDDTQGWLVRKVKLSHPEQNISPSDHYVFPLAGYRWDSDGNKTTFKYRPMLVGSYSEAVYVKTSFVFESPETVFESGTQKPEMVCPNTKVLCPDYYYHIELDDQDGATVDGKMDITLCTNPSEDLRLTAVSHLDDEAAHGREDVPVWKFTGRMYYVPAKILDPESNTSKEFATFEGFNECSVKEWTDFSQPAFTLIEAGVAFQVSDLLSSAYLRNYPLEDEADPTRVPADGNEAFAPKTVPLEGESNFTIELLTGPTSTKSSLTIKVDEHLALQEVLIDPDGEGDKFPLSEDLYTAGENQLALVEFSKKPLSSINKCTSQMKVLLKDGLVLTPRQSEFNSFQLSGIESVYDVSVQIFNQYNEQINTIESGAITDGVWEADWSMSNIADEGFYNFVLAIQVPNDDGEPVNVNFHGQFIVDLTE